jgi:succinyl-CoA synthetase beta subunit
MDLFEYQARDVFAKHDVPVLAGGVAETPEDVVAYAGEDFGGAKPAKFLEQADTMDGAARRAAELAAVAK